jgi:hypothetical protein
MMRYFLPIGVVLALIGPAWAQDEEPQFRFRKGDAVRFNCINENGTPIPVCVCETLDELERELASVSRALKAGGSLPPEDAAFLGHNTRGTVIDVASAALDGRRIEVERVTVDSGTLEGEEFWVSGRRLRPADEPDPAKEPKNRSALAQIWDIAYVPKAGDTVILANRAVTLAPMAVVLVPGQAATQPRATGNANLFYAATGTKATVMELKAAASDDEIEMARVRITSGPFSGQTGWTFCMLLCRPDVFEKASGKQGGPRSMLTDPAPAPSKKRSGRRPTQAQVPVATGDLVLIDVAANPSASGNYLKVVGRVRNTSDHDFKFVKITGAFEDSLGKLVRSSSSYCDPQTIAPGGIASFEVSTESDARIAGYKLDFHTLDAAIPWVNRSGKNVHQ